MEKEFVPYELAVKLKALGFDKPCFAFYQREYAEVIPVMVDDNEQYRLTGFRTCKNSEIPEHCISVPTFSQCFRWFREKGYDVKVAKESAGLYFGFYWTGAAWIIVGNGTYEEAESACLTKLVEIVESKSE